MKVGEVSAPLNLGQNWTVFQVAAREEANPADFEKQKRSITDQLLQQKRSLAYDAFRTSLEERLKQDGKLKMYPEKLRAFGAPLNL